MGDATRYERFIGSFIHLTITGPELTYAVHILSQFMPSSKEDYMEVARRVSRYLKGGASEGKFLHAKIDLQLYGYCDSVWGAYPLSKCSLTGYFVTREGSPIF